MVAGGSPASLEPPLRSTEVFDPATNAWKRSGDLNEARAFHQVVTLKNGEVLAVGGLAMGGAARTPMASAELYSPADGRWRLTGSLRTPRFAHTATVLDGPLCGQLCGHVLVVGGANLGGGNVFTAELYDPRAGTWTDVQPPPLVRNSQTAVLLSGPRCGENCGKVLVAGGNGGQQVAASAYLYDPSVGSWTATADRPLPTAQAVDAALTDGTVLIVGGFARNKSGETPELGRAGTPQIFDPTNQRWMLTPPIPMKNPTITGGDAVLSALPDGRAVLVGAQGFGAQVAEFDPQLSQCADMRGAWSTLPPVLQGRRGHTVSVLATGDGAVSLLVVGGEVPPDDAPVATASTERYVPPPPSSRASPASKACGALTPDPGSRVGNPWVVPLVLLVTAALALVVAYRRYS